MTAMEVPAAEGSIIMHDVPGCCCRYVTSPVDTTDVKLIDTRCIKAYFVPIPKARVDVKLGKSRWRSVDEHIMSLDARLKNALSNPNLGLATTAQLIDELVARLSPGEPGEVVELSPDTAVKATMRGYLLGIRDSLSEEDRNYRSVS